MVQRRKPEPSDVPPSPVAKRKAGDEVYLNLELIGGTLKGTYTQGQLSTSRVAQDFISTFSVTTPFTNTLTITRDPSKNEVFRRGFMHSVVFEGDNTAQPSFSFIIEDGTERLNETITVFMGANRQGNYNKINATTKGLGSAKYNPTASTRYFIAGVYNEFQLTETRPYGPRGRQIMSTDGSTINVIIEVGSRGGFGNITNIGTFLSMSAFSIYTV